MNLKDTFIFFLIILLFSSNYYIYKKTNNIGKNSFVVFDYIKLENSLKKKLGNDKTRELAAERYKGEIQQTIERVANGKVVLVKEAVIEINKLNDITDIVLTSLGLPTDVSGFEEIPYVSPLGVIDDSNLNEFVGKMKQKDEVKDVLLTDEDIKKLEKKDFTVEDFFRGFNSNPDKPNK